MPITSQEIIEKLNPELKKFLVLSGTEIIEISIDTNNYIHNNGERSIGIIFKIEEEGRLLKIIAPYLYIINKRNNTSVKNLYQTLLQICWQTKLVQFEYDNENGEIRAVIETAVEDGTLTNGQINRMIETLLRVIEQYHTEIDAFVSGRNDYISSSPSDELIARYNKVFNTRNDQKLNSRI